jgi:hypothetical protein
MGTYDGRYVVLTLSVFLGCNANRTAQDRDAYPECVGRVSARQQVQCRSRIRGAGISGHRGPVCRDHLAVLPSHLSLSTYGRRRATSWSPRTVARVMVSVALVVVKGATSACKISSTPSTPNATATVCGSSAKRGRVRICRARRRGSVAGVSARPIDVEIARDKVPLVAWISQVANG